MVARQTPTGAFLRDGYQTLIAFTDDPDVSLWEKQVQPPGIDGGDAIEITTMHNTNWRTMFARSLKTMTEANFTSAYDPQVYTQILSLINVNQLITVHFPDASTLDFWGYLQTFEPGDHEEGEQPEAECTITPTNYNHTSGNEVAPVMTDGGT